MEEEDTHPPDHTFGILVVGDLATGKTSLIRRFVNNVFSLSYRATIGVEFASRVIDWDANTRVEIHLRDIAGQERFSNMTRAFYKGAVGAFVVFDVARPSTLTGAAKWKNDIDTKVSVGIENKPIPVVLLANKVDLNESFGSNTAEMDVFCRENKFATSAKDNIGIDKAVGFLINRILENKVTERPAEKGVKVNSEKETTKCCK